MSVQLTYRLYYGNDVLAYTFSTISINPDLLDTWQSVQSVIGQGYNLKFEIDNSTANNLQFELFYSSTPLYHSEEIPPGETSTRTPVMGECYLRVKFSAAEPAFECEENFDCPEGEKCVEGECVPCDDQSATHFQVRFEYEELVTTSDANQVMATLSSIYSISGSEGQIIQGQETNGIWYYPRIRFCDSAGEAKPYTGALAFYGFCNPDGSTALYSNNRNITEKSWVIGQKAITDSVSANPWSVPRILIEFIEQSKIVHEVRCSGVDPEEFPPIDPVEPSEPEEPLPPDPGDPPDEIDEPLPPDPVDGTGGGEPPPEPQEGLCDCEKYLAKMILAGTQQIRNAIVEHGNQLDARLADGHSVLYERITSLERVIYQQHSETNRLLYELSMFLFQPFYSEVVLIRKTLQKSLESGDDGLIDIVKTGLVGEEKGLVDYAKDFVEQYEPVTIENEYRTQSHRVIDNLDEVVSKL